MRRRNRVLAFALLPVLAVVLLALLWDWDWFIPLVDRRASAAIGRPVTVGHLHLQLGRKIRLVADDVVIANPQGFPAGQPPLARVPHLTVLVDAGAYLNGRGLVMPQVALDHPQVSAVQTADGQDNYTLHLPQHAGGGGPHVTVGQLAITDGQVHAVIPKLRSDFQVAVNTRAGQAGEAGALVAQARGTYAGQPITADVTGGDVLSLRDAAHPYPLQVRLRNGATEFAAEGSIADPLHLKGVNLKLGLAGANMADLYHLAAVPLPQTPRYRLSGRLGYADGRIRLDDLAGQVGESDLEGSITEAPGARERNGKPVPDITMDLRSRRVNLADLGGAIATTPGTRTEANATPEQREAVARAERSSGNLLPTQPFDLSRLNAADVHVRYEGARIEGRNMPLDNVSVAMDVVNGAVDVHPVSFGVGHGSIRGTVSLTPRPKGMLLARADIGFDRVDVARLMAATHTFHGAGSIGGRARFEGVGNSVASWAAGGDGGVDLYMAGGSLSALLVDISGLEFGDALLSALGMPRQTPVKCLAGVFALREGVVTTRSLLLDTGEGIIGGTGTIDLRDERIAYRLQTKPKHFTVGTLNTPIDIGGTLKHPSVGPETKELAARGVGAVALGFLAGPLALLPTIQFGTDDPHACEGLVQESRAQSASGNVGAPVPQHPQ